jgi:hypothetical protein
MACAISDSQALAAKRIKFAAGPTSAPGIFAAGAVSHSSFSARFNDNCPASTFCG